MYEEYFGLQERPFLSEPQSDRFFPAQVSESARQTLARTIQRGEGAGVIIGPPGTGKTLLCHVLANQFRQRFVVVLLCGGRLRTPQALFQTILYELGLPYRGLDEGELRLSLVDFLCHSSERPEAMLLLVDEAHTLPGRLLEEIRMTMNWISDGQPGSRVVLAGAPLLEERLTSPKLEALNQRIVARCYLEAFDRPTTAAYIEWMIHRAGGRADTLFPPAARETVYRATDGVPRLINQLCDHALVLACAAGSRSIGPQLVEEAWADLQQLPAPWNENPTEAQPQQVVEFGTLDDEATESASSTAEATSAEDGNEAGLGDYMAKCDPCAAAGEPPVGGQADKPAVARAQTVVTEYTGARNPCETIEQVQQVLATIEGRAAADLPPRPKGNPVVPSVPDPFSEPFDEEEVVVDNVVPTAAAQALAVFRGKQWAQAESYDRGGKLVDEVGGAKAEQSLSANAISLLPGSRQEPPPESAVCKADEPDEQPADEAEMLARAVDSLGEPAEQIVIEFGAMDEASGDAPSECFVEPGSAVSKPAAALGRVENAETEEEVVALPIHRRDEVATAVRARSDGPSSVSGAASERTLLHRALAEPEGASDDRDIITIEPTSNDEPDRLLQPAVCRRQYRQLFARLRRAETSRS